MGQLVKKGPPSALPQRDKLGRCMISTGWLFPKARRNLGCSDVNGDLGFQGPVAEATVSVHRSNSSAHHPRD